MGSLEAGVEPLQPQLSNKSPRDGTIVSRSKTNAAKIPTYNVKIGGVTVRGIGLDDILEYVSPQHYEAFENASFSHDAEAQDLRAFELTQIKRRPGRPRKDTSDSHSSTSNSENSRNEAASDDDPEDDLGLLPTQSIFTKPVAIGRHGRPRPTYDQFYLQRGNRGRGRGRGRPRGRGGIPRAQFELATHASTESDLDVTEVTTVLSLNENFKRRRLNHAGASSREQSETLRSSSSSAVSNTLPTPKRQVVIELPASAERRIPNPTSATKRVTLMSLPPAPNSISSTSSSVVDSDSDDGDDDSIDIPALKTQTAVSNHSSPSPQPPTLSDYNTTRPNAQPQSKPSTASSSRASQAGLNDHIYTSRANGRIPLGRIADYSLSAAGNDDKQTPKANGLTRYESIAIPSSSSSAASESESEDGSTAESEIVVATFSNDNPAKSLSRGKAHTSALTQQAQQFDTLTTRANNSHQSQQSNRPSISQVDNEESEDSPEETYEIERIVSHQLSDPSTHPEGLGGEAVMLYQVKWLGYDGLSWEPIGSFVDPSVVEKYWAKVKGKKSKSVSGGFTKPHG